jgi:hypothetical protein
VPASYALGTTELILSLGLLLGFYRTISYGLSLLVHTVTVVVSWRQLFDPWGLDRFHAQKTQKLGNNLIQKGLAFGCDWSGTVVNPERL